MTIARLIVDVAANTASLDRSMQQVNSTIDSVTGTIKTLAGAIGITFTADKVIGMAREILTFASNTVDMANQVGIGVERVQALNYALSGAGVTVDEMAVGVAQLAKRLVGGDDTAASAIAKLGLNTQQLIDMSPDEAFLDIVAAVSKLPNPMEQSAVMMELFGRNGSKYLRLVHEDLRALADEAEHNGAVISRELIEKADSLDDAWGRVVIRGKAFIASVLIPMMDELRHGGLAVLNDSLVAITKTLQSPVYAGPGALKPLSMSMLEADHIAKNLTEQVNAHVRAVEEMGRKEALAFKAQMENAKHYFEMIDKVEKDMLDVRRDLESKFYVDQQRIAEAAGQRLLETTLQLNQSLISLDAERTRNLLAVNMPGMGTTNDAGKLAGASFGSKFLDGLKGNLGGLNAIFEAAFTGGGGAIGAVKAFATQTLSTVLGLIPGIGPILSQFAGAFMAAFGKIGAAFKRMFGGPGADELDARSVFNDYADSLGAVATEAQLAAIQQHVAEGSTRQWAEMAVTLIDKYKLVGLTGEDALADIDRMQQATHVSGAAVQQVIDQIAEKTKGVGAAFDDSATSVTELANSAINAAENAEKIAQGTEAVKAFGVAAAQAATDTTSAFHAMYDEIMSIRAAIAQDITVHVGWAIDAPPDVGGLNVTGGTEGFAAGTHGAYPDFGSGTLVTLHHRERVMPEAEGRRESAMSSEAAERSEALQSEVAGLRSDLKRMMRELPIHFRSAMLTSGMA